MHDVFEQDGALPFEQGVMLWAMRVWVIGVHHEIGAGSRIEDLMQRLGAEDAVSHLDGFMFALGRGAKRRIEIQCTCHGEAGVDERILLDVLSLSQEGRLLEASLLLRGVVRDDAVRVVLRSAEGLAHELALAGCFLRGEEGEGRGVLCGEGGGLGRGAATLH